MTGSEGGLTPRSAAVLAGFVALVATVSALGGVVTAGAVGCWYRTLARPAFTPPDWLFAPVWSALYLTIAVAGWLVWRRGGFGAAGRAFGLYGLQLALNLGWSLLFFGLHAIGAALIEIVVLELAVLLTLRRFYRLVPAAGLLLVPYAAWVGFAILLNAGFWWLNP